MEGPEPASVDRLFYDGDCGLCHSAVQFAIRHDRRAVFRFAPLHGPTFNRVLTGSQRSSLPDSLVVHTGDGRLLVRSAAVGYLLKQLRGGWMLLAALLWIIPRPIRDLGYDLVAAVRRRLFARPQSACPVVAPSLRARFDD